MIFSRFVLAHLIIWESTACQPHVYNPIYEDPILAEVHCSQRLEKVLTDVQISKGLQHMVLSWDSDECICGVNLDLHSGEKHVSAMTVYDNRVVLCGLPDDQSSTELRVSLTPFNEHEADGEMIQLRANPTEVEHNEHADRFSCSHNVTAMSLQHARGETNSVRHKGPKQPEMLYSLQVLSFPIGAFLGLAVACLLARWLPYTSTTYNAIMRREVLFGFTVMNVVFLLFLAGLLALSVYAVAHTINWKTHVLFAQINYSSAKISIILTIVIMSFSVRHNGLSSMLKQNYHHYLRFHIIISHLVIVAASVHVLMFLGSYDFSHLMSKPKNCSGFASMILMWVVWLSAFLVNVFGYKAFRVVHWLTIPSALLLMHHVWIIDMHRYGQLGMTTLMYILVVVWVILSKTIAGIQAWLSSRSAAGGMTSVVDIDDGHIEVTFSVSGPMAKSKPGAWATLYVPSISVVGHPFTIVPCADNSVKFIVKVGGAFTQKLKALSDRTALPPAFLSGPIDNGADLRQFKTHILICGGVGITPAVSLALRFPDAFLFWSFRSERLFQAALPLVDPENCALHYTGAGKAPQGCSQGRGSIEEFLESIAPKAVGPVVVFTCGPVDMQAEAKRLAAKFHWHALSESFCIL